MGSSPACYAGIVAATIELGVVTSLNPTILCCSTHHFVIVIATRRRGAIRISFYLPAADSEHVEFVRVGLKTEIRYVVHDSTVKVGSRALFLHCFT